MKTGVFVSQVMRKNVLQTEPGVKVIDVAKLMAREEVGSVVITENDKVLGIITEQDLARNVLAKGINPNTTTISDVMSSDIYTISPEVDIYEAMVKMGKYKIKHLPVIMDDRLLGIISFKDIINIEPDLIELLSFKSSLTEEEKNKIFRGNTE